MSIQISKVYLAGPMSGIPQFNIPAFESAAARLRKSGYEVIVPHELDNSSGLGLEKLKASKEGAPEDHEKLGATWGDLLARDVKIIADEGVQAVVVLKGWQKSRGARLEVFVALLCGLPVFYYAAAFTQPLRLIPTDSIAIELTQEWRTQ